jgi:hypothetical protein
MSAPYQSPPVHIPPAQLAAWLDSLSEEQRAAVMLSPGAYAKARPKWDTLTAEEKAKVYLAEPAGHLAGCDLSDKQVEPHIASLHASDVRPQSPDEALIDAEETKGINPDHPYIIELATQRAARTVFEVIDWIVSVGEREPQTVNLHHRLDSADTKLVCLAWMLGIREFGKIPLAHLAEQMGLTRAALSHCALIVRDKWNIFQRGQRSDTARKVYAERQRDIWEHRPRQASGLLLKNATQRQRVADFFAANPDAGAAELRLELGCSERTAYRLTSAYRKERAANTPATTSAPCRVESFDTAQGA